MNWLDHYSEKSARLAARRLSRRSLVAGLGTLLAGAAALPLLPVARGAEPWQVLSGLLALLELARRGELTLRQRRPFASVEIARVAAGQAA